MFLFALWLYFIKKYIDTHNNKFIIYASIVSGVASSVRIMGLSLTLTTVYVYIKQNTFNIKTMLYTICYSTLSSFGFIVYATYLWIKFKDPLMFFHVQSMFGANRSNGKIITPIQTLWRYIKIFATAQPTTILYWRAVFEFIAFIFGVYLLFVLYKQVPNKNSKYASIYIIPSTIMLFIPALTGTLSSMPRYILPIIPLFYAWTEVMHIEKQIKLQLFINFVIQLLLLTLFITGTFIA